MRRRHFLVAGALICASLYSNAEIISTVPERNPGGKIIGVSESQTRAVYPKMPVFSWGKDGSVAVDAPEPEKPAWKLPSSSDRAVSYGTSVSRNEFGINGGVFPSPDGNMVACYRKDESAVSTFPLLDISTRTGSLKSIYYPMNGMASERISLCVCDTLGNVLSTIEPDDFTPERYLTCVSWSPDSRYIYIQVEARSQHDMRLNVYRASDGSYVKTLLSEHNEAWVEPQEPLHFIDADRFIYTTDNRDGFNSLYVCDTLGGIRRLTEIAADVHFAGISSDAKGSWIYYTSAEVSPVENHLFRIRVRNGRTLAKMKFSAPERLTAERGWHEISLNAGCTQFIDRWSSFGMPGRIMLRNTDGSDVRQLAEAADPLEDYARCEVEFGTVKSEDGKFDNYYRLFKPLGFDPGKKYPLIIYVYGGPHSQMVQDKWLGNVRMWEMVMAQRGYVVYVQDNRGTANRGAAFEKAINRRCGQEEMADQMAGLKALLERAPWIDRERMGIHGWSYGGFMTITMFTNHPDMFRTAVAGGPVIDWKWYEVMYGERYMDTPETNPEGFELTSLMNMTSGVHGKLLICQGAIDNTVVWQHSLSFTQKCITEGKQLDYFPYPCDEHNMRGKARMHLYEKITQYFEENL